MATPEEIAAQRRATLEAAARQPVYGPRNPQQPIASPGYSDDLNTRRVQAYRDAQQQRAAVAGEPLVSPGYTPGLASMQAAQDARMQRDAVAALPPPRVAGRDPYVPAPTPVTPTTPVAQPPAQPGVAADFQRGLVGTAKAGAGALVYPAALALDASRRGVTSLVGGDVNTLPGGADYLTHKTEGVMASGYEDASGAAASLRGRTAEQGRGLLGVQPTQAAPSASVTPVVAGAQPAAQTQAPTTTNEQVLAQDRANTAAFVASQPGAPTTTLSPDLLAETNQRIASAIEGSRGPTYANKRGEYSMTGTSPDVVADAHRRADTGSGGINFGFAPGEATARMQGYAAQDARAREAFQTKRQRLDAAVEGIGLRNTMEKGNVFERRAAGARMEELQKQGLMATQQEGETGRANIAAGAELERARIAGQYGLLGAQTQGEYGLEGQDIAGKYGLLAADIKAQADQQVAAASVDPKKQQEAMLLAARNQQLLDAIARDDQEAIRFYTSGKYAPVAQGDRSPISGITYDKPTVAAMQESERLRAQQQLQAQKTQ